jgi:predicted aspartyl protease
VPDTRKILVSTAGGITSAWETVIPTIEINNYKVKNVKALVLDIPSNPTLGLLGQNYLERFQVEIDNEKGLLLLKPL